MYNLICQRCLKSFQQSKKPRQKTCSKQCSLELRWTEASREQQRQKLFKQRNDPTFVSANLDYLLNRNCMKRPEIRQKVSDALSGKDFPAIRGGNGTGLTVPQKILLSELGNGWFAEHVVFSKGFLKDWPLMIVDLAFPARKIAVEINGLSHNTLSIKKRDQRKKEILQSLGWLVRSFTNEEILGDCKKIAAHLKSILE